MRGKLVIGSLMALLLVSTPAAAREPAPSTNADIGDRGIHAAAYLIDDRGMHVGAVYLHITAIGQQATFEVLVAARRASEHKLVRGNLRSEQVRFDHGGGDVEIPLSETETLMMRITPDETTRLPIKGRSTFYYFEDSSGNQVRYETHGFAVDGANAVLEGTMGSLQVLSVPLWAPRPSNSTVLIGRALTVLSECTRISGDGQSGPC